MNIPLRRLGIVMGLMIIALMLSTTVVQFFQAPTLNADSRNVRTIYRQFGTDRGPIVVAGESIAWSQPTEDPVYVFERIYGQGSLYAHVTGYFSVAFNSTSGLERMANDVLGGTADSLLLSRIQDLFTGSQPQGGSVELTINPAVQQAMADAIGNQAGAAVAIDPRTGAILGMYSSPSYDPNTLATHVFSDANAAWDALNADQSMPLLNRATSQLYPPGSIFKVVVAAAWLSMDPTRTVDSQVPTPATYLLPGTSTTISNSGGSNCGPTDTNTLEYAFAHSCNTTFAALAVEVGVDRLRAQAEALGYGSEFQIPMTVEASVFPESLDSAQLALSGLGQYDIRSTVMEAAMMAAAVANDGVLMEPYLIQTERDADLGVISEASSTVYSQPFDATMAANLTQLMTAVVEYGTGTPAAIPGVTVAGKTGTAETGNDQPQHAWMIAFAPAEDPVIAVAAILENGGTQGSGAYGGTAVGPILRSVIQAALQ